MLAGKRGTAGGTDSGSALFCTATDTPALKDHLSTCSCNVWVCRIKIYCHCKELDRTVAPYGSLQLASKEGTPITYYAACMYPSTRDLIIPFLITPNRKTFKLRNRHANGCQRHTRLINLITACSMQKSQLKRTASTQPASLLLACPR